MKKTAKDYIYVSVQLLLFVAYILPFYVVRFSNFSVIDMVAILLIVLGIITGLLAVLQLNKNLSPFPTPKSNSELVQSGLYRYIRHPMYTSILLTCTGYAIYTGSVYKTLVTICLLLLFIFKSNYEEEKLSRKFTTYTAYKKKTGRFFPKLF